MLLFAYQAIVIWTITEHTLLNFYKRRDTATSRVLLIVKHELTPCEEISPVST